MACQTVAQLTDAQGYLIARVSRMKDFQDLNYVAITKDGNVITVDVQEVPELLRAIIRAANI